jgi:hypothetical protein
MKTTRFKNTLKLLLLCWLCFTKSFGQTQTIIEIPRAIAYEAYALDENGNNLSENQNISLRLTILHNDISGSVDWIERHQTITGDRGYFSVQIGTGIRTGGVQNFSEVDWIGPHFLKIEIDILGGNNFSLSATEEFTSVPFAFRAAVADNLEGIDREILLDAVFDSSCHCMLQDAYDNGTNMPNGYTITFPGIPNDQVSFVRDNPGDNFWSTVNGYHNGRAAVFSTKIAANYISASMASTVKISNLSVGEALEVESESPGPDSVNHYKMFTASFWSRNLDGGSLYSFTSDGNNPAPNFIAISNGKGPAGYFKHNHPNSVEPALKAEIVDGTVITSAGAAEFLIANTDNNARAVAIETNGLGNALTVRTFGMNSSANPLPTVAIENTNGTGQALSTHHKGSSGNAGYFKIFNANNDENCLHVVNDGRGLAGYFESTQDQNDNYATRVINKGDRGSGGYFETNISLPNLTAAAVWAEARGVGSAGIFKNTATAISSSSPVLFIEQNAASIPLRIHELSQSNANYTFEIYSGSMGRMASWFNANQNNTQDLIYVGGKGTGKIMWLYASNSSTSSTTTNPVARFSNLGSGGNRTGVYIDNNSSSNALFAENKNTGAVSVTSRFVNQSNTSVLPLTPAGSALLAEGKGTANGAHIRSHNNVSLIASPIDSANPNPTLLVFNGSGYGAIIHGALASYNFRSSGTTSTVIKNQNVERHVYSEQSPEVWFTDYGIGQLVNGHATINFDNIYISSINTTSPFHVFVQMEGECEGGFFVTRNATGFEVTQQDISSNSNAQFSYRVSAKRKYYEANRYSTEAENQAANAAMLQQTWPEELQAATQQVANYNTTYATQLIQLTDTPEQTSVPEPLVNTTAVSQNPAVLPVSPVTETNFIPGPNMPHQP